ncbi:MAG: CRTAC1 family protein, partial [Planctomycetes bacterium]|nr:CRTAC1 family protein [Planctomycetota bacterium]
MPKLLVTLALLVFPAALGAATTHNPAPANQGSIESIPLNQPSSYDGDTLFEKKENSQIGIDFRHIWNPPKGREIELDSATPGGGVCIGDFDGDNLPDIFLTRPHDPDRLYKNLGNFQFADVTEEAGINHHAWSNGATFADIDNDGDLDLFICTNNMPNLLYINQGDGTFKERAKQFGLDFKGASIMMAFADYDGDGDLDAYLVTNRLNLSEPVEAVFKTKNGEVFIHDTLLEQHDLIMHPNGKHLVIQAGQYDRLYRNNGDGTFTNVSKQAGISGNHRGLSATWWDFNNDRLPDLYVANDFYGPDHLYKNNGDGTFTDVIAQTMPHTPWFSMGADVADINNDDLLDFMGSDMSGSSHFKQKLSMGEMTTAAWFLQKPTPRQYMRNTLYLNTGTERFMEAAYLAGLADTDWTWSIKFADLDNDSHVDLFITNGMTRDWVDSDLLEELEKIKGKTDRYYSDNFWKDKPKRAEPNLAYKNLGNLRFKSVGPQWGLDHVGVSFGAALADLDRDGDLDLVVNNFDEPPSIYQNHVQKQHRILIRLVGKSSNRYGIGATVKLNIGSAILTRYLTLSRGFMSANEPVIHYGLENHKTIDRLTILWPSGHTQTFNNLPADRFYTVTEPTGP